MNLLYSLREVTFLAYELGDTVEMRKAHPCGANVWTIVRTGADFKLKCQGCGHVVMLSREYFEAKVRKSLSKGSETRVSDNP
jgi:hypothetical protein